MSISNAQVRIGSSADWAASTLVMRDDEIGFDSDTNVWKGGDGTNVWSALPGGGTGRVTSTTAALAAIGNAINTVDKYVGKPVFNTTTSKTVYAVGATAGALWLDHAGATAHTPV